MSNLEEFLNNKLPEEQDDQFMEKITRRRMDGMRMNYEQKLENSYGISKENPLAKNTKRRMLKILLLTSSIAASYFLLLTFGILGGQEDFSKDIAAYITENKVHNYDIVRGGPNDEAYNEYQLGNYNQAIEIWKKEEMNLQDTFYLSMSYLYEGQYKDAEANFNALNSMLASDEKFYPEQQLYWTLTLVMLGENDRAANIYDSWPGDSWMAGEYRKIMSLED